MATRHNTARLAACSDRYFALERVEVLEELVGLGGPALDGRALPLLLRRLAEEDEEGARLRARGYTRMAEKSARLAASLRRSSRSWKGVTMAGSGTRGWARDVTGLRASAQAKAAATRQRVEEALRRLTRENTPVTFRAVAAAAPCSTAWLYGQADLKARIMHLRAQQGPRATVAIPPRERASDASKDAVIAALRKANKQLREENATLRRQVEVAYGELAARG